MPADMPEITGDLAAETAALTALVTGLDEAGWRAPTPAAGWNVGDQFSHLAFFDDAAIRAATDPEGFTAERDQALAAGVLDPDDIAARYRSLAPDELLAWLGASRKRLIEVFGAMEPGQRIPWYGPPMSAASAVTARIMETWAHGQDVADALGVVRDPTARLRHVALLGVLALPYSFAAHGREVPAEPVRVELAGPGGQRWTWGPPDAANLVTGPALDFCLLVTQRRHPADLAVRARGVVAGEWLAIAQAFAGPPGPGRRPGQHG